MAGYRYNFAIKDSDHFVNRYIRYASERTDAPWDYHEAMAYVLLGTAMQGVRWAIPAIPGGLRTNLYIIQHGISSFAKKSTAMLIAKEIQKTAMPGCNLPAEFTPGALQEALAERSDAPSIVWQDEFDSILDRMHHQSFMSGMRSFLMTMYGESDYTYRRTSKGTGKKKTNDKIDILDSHLSFVGNTTPAISRRLTLNDIEDGFMARFILVYPDDHPAYKGLCDMHDDIYEKKLLSDEVESIRNFGHGIGRALNARPDANVIRLDPEVIPYIDAKSLALNRWLMNRQPAVQAVTQRLTTSLLKICMLNAIGRPKAHEAGLLRITLQDAEEANTTIEKWRKFAIRFIQDMSPDIIDNDIKMALVAISELGNEVSRTQVARRLRFSKRRLDEIQMTLVDRGEIGLEERRINGASKPSLFWIIGGNKSNEVPVPPEEECSQQQSAQPSSDSESTSSNAEPSTSTPPPAENVT